MLFGLDASEEPPNTSKSIPDTKATLNPLMTLTPDLPKKFRPLVSWKPPIVFFEFMKGPIKGVESIKCVGIEVSTFFFR